MGSSMSSASQYAARGTFASIGMLPPSGILATMSTRPPPAPDARVYSRSKSQCWVMPADSATFFSDISPHFPLSFVEPRSAVDSLTFVSLRSVACWRSPSTVLLRP